MSFVVTPLFPFRWVVVTRTRRFYFHVHFRAFSSPISEFLGDRLGSCFYRSHFPSEVVLEVFWAVAMLYDEALCYH